MIPHPTTTCETFEPTTVVVTTIPPIRPAKVLSGAITGRYDAEAEAPTDREEAFASLTEVTSPWPTGRLVELSGAAASSARTTVAVREVVRLQREGELVAWVQARGGTLYPPDAAEAGVDLASLTVVHVPSSALEAARAAELLLRSGAFGLVLVDLEGMVDARLPSRALARLHALCRQHGSTVAFLSPPAQEALGSLVSMRLEPRRTEVRAQLTHELTHELAVALPIDDASKISERRERVETSADLHAVESEVRRDKLGHVPARSIHRGPLGLTPHDELTSPQPGVVVPFRRRSSDEATLPLPFFEARDVG